MLILFIYLQLFARKRPYLRNLIWVVARFRPVVEKVHGNAVQ